MKAATFLPPAPRTLGERMADRIAAFGGSWTFILLFLAVLAVWTLGNTELLGPRRAAFDPYPYVFLNLILSMLTALQAPVIMMSQNRGAERDRLNAATDYRVNVRAEHEVRRLHEKHRRLARHTVDGARPHAARADHAADGAGGAIPVRPLGRPARRPDGARGGGPGRRARVTPGGPSPRPRPPPEGPNSDPWRTSCCSRRAARGSPASWGRRSWRWG
jgi:uncharacterized membrane protein